MSLGRAAGGRLHSGLIETARRDWQQQALIQSCRSLNTDIITESISQSVLVKTDTKPWEQRAVTRSSTFASRRSSSGWKRPRIRQINNRTCKRHSFIREKNIELIFIRAGLINQGSYTFCPMNFHNCSSRTLTNITYIYIYLYWLYE